MGNSDVFLQIMGGIIKELASYGDESDFSDTLLKVLTAKIQELSRDNDLLRYQLETVSRKAARKAGNKSIAKGESIDENRSGRATETA